MDDTKNDTNGKLIENSIDQNDSDEKIKCNLELFRKLNGLCKNLGFCLRCQLRYLGELYSSTSFVLSQKELKEKINEKLQLTDDEDESVKRFKSGTFCYCCTGLLENGSEDVEIDKILNKISTFEYKFKDFQIHLFLPVTITIREHVAFAKLLNKFQGLEQHLKDCYKIKDVYKFILIRKISKAADAKFNVDARTEISIETEYGNMRIECMELYDKCKNEFNLNSRQKFEVTFSQPNVNKALASLGIKGLLGFKLNRSDRSINLKAITITNQSLYMVGRYNKYSREISQTPWIVNDKVRRESLEEIISKELKKHIACEKTKFMASGREDVDVRMLGRGRPFLIEIINPVLLDIDASVFIKIKNDVQIASNNDVNLNDLQFGDKQDITKYLKQGEMEKKKIYKALCVSTRPIEQKDVDKLSTIKDLKIEQDTPIRVLHRRNLSTRPKIIHDLQIELIDNEKYKFNLIMTTEAGTYVKEFVNSDFGRTSPSLETILGDCETDILELDVLEVCFDWPPQIKIDTET